MNLRSLIRESHVWVEVEIVEEVGVLLLPTSPHFMAWSKAIFPCLDSNLGQQNKQVGVAWKKWRRTSFWVKQPKSGL